MRRICKTVIAALTAIAAGAALLCVVAAQTGLDAIVEKDGSVVLCIASGGILFADRCEGAGRLRIVQPLAEGPITWRGADGTIAMENESPQNPDCALSKAKWDTEKERTARSGKQVRKVDGAEVLAQIDKNYPDIADLKAEDIAALALDLDNDGKDEIVFTASNLDRMMALQNKTEKPHHYLTLAAILRPDARYPDSFYRESGEYSGPTGGLGMVKTLGVVPLAPGTGEIALLLRYNWEFIDEVTLVRVRGGGVQRIEGVGQRCQ